MTDQELKKIFEELAAKGLVRDSGQRRRNPETGEWEVVWVTFEELAAIGLVRDSGQRRRNPDTGEFDIVWVATELGKATEDWGLPVFLQ